MSNTLVEASSYTEQINIQLKPKINTDLPLVVDLFAGCGGMSLGFEAQGSPTVGFEVNRDACDSYTNNLIGECHAIDLTMETTLPHCALLIGGPPCQPFSVGGNQQGLADARDGFPIFIAAVDRGQPELFIIENVRGLFYRNKWYLEEVMNALRRLSYLVDVQLLNASNYGVPQNRERVFLVGHRGKFEFPQASHEKMTAGQALGNMALSIPVESKFLTLSMDEYVAKYERASKCVNPRDLHLDRPARTLTCRNLAGATGDMQRLLLADGRRRRLLPREGARLQSFPDWFVFTGKEQSVFNQIGNAVPPMLGYHLAASCCRYLESTFRYSLDDIDRINRIYYTPAKSEQMSLF
jgi:DNA (cytosine-5)-methyltransferase 1